MNTDTSDPAAAPAGRARRWPWRLALLVCALVVAARLWLAPTPEAFAAGTSLDAAIERAAAEGRPVVAVATSDFCLPCQSYKRGTLTDEAVAGWLERKAVPCLTRIEWDTADAERLGRANGPVPATFFLVDGEVVATLEGNVPAQELFLWLEENLAQRFPRAAAAEGDAR